MKSDNLFNTLLLISSIKEADTHHWNKDTLDFMANISTLSGLYDKIARTVNHIPYKQLSFDLCRLYLNLISSNKIIPAEVKFKAVCNAVDFSKINPVYYKTSDKKLGAAWKTLTEAVLRELGKARFSSEVGRLKKDFERICEESLVYYMVDDVSTPLLKAVNKFIEGCRLEGEIWVRDYYRFWIIGADEFLELVVNNILDYTNYVNPFDLRQEE